MEREGAGVEEEAVEAVNERIEMQHRAAVEEVFEQAAVADEGRVTLTEMAWVLQDGERVRRERQVARRPADAVDELMEWLVATVEDRVVGHDWNRFRVRFYPPGERTGPSAVCGFREVEGAGSPDGITLTTSVGGPGAVAGAAPVASAVAGCQRCRELDLQLRRAERRLLDLEDDANSDERLINGLLEKERRFESQQRMLVEALEKFEQQVAEVSEERDQALAEVKRLEKEVGKQSRRLARANRWIEGAKARLKLAEELRKHSDSLVEHYKDPSLAARISRFAGL